MVRCDCGRMLAIVRGGTYVTCPAGHTAFIPVNPGSQPQILDGEVFRGALTDLVLDEAARDHVVEARE